MTPEDVSGRHFIYVMERGYVLAVIESRGQESDALFVTLDVCEVVRVWGTDAGLGQLAFEGPRPATKLDPEPCPQQVNRRAIYRRIPCRSAQWISWLRGQREPTS